MSPTTNRSIYVRGDAAEQGFSTIGSWGLGAETTIGGRSEALPAGGQTPLRTPPATEDRQVDQHETPELGERDKSRSPVPINVSLTSKRNKVGSLLGRVGRPWAEKAIRPCAAQLPICSAAPVQNQGRC